jgi:hypothetical protein
LAGIFKQYYQKKLIIWGGIALIALFIRYSSKPETSILFGFAIILALLAIGLINGFIDYRFYEKSAPRLESNLLEQKPLLEFKANGFSKEDGNKIGGYINNYKIFLAPLVNIEGEKWLTILIPLQIREGLDNYFNKFDEIFKFKLSDQLLFAEAILKGYDKTYDFRKLITLLEKTTLSLHDKKIMPINIVEE